MSMGAIIKEMTKEIENNPIEIRKAVDKCQRQLEDAMKVVSVRKPFLFRFARHVSRYFASFSTPTASVGYKGTEILFRVNPFFFDAMTLEERIGVVCHEYLHILHQHLSRLYYAPGVNHKIMNYAQDVICNREILIYEPNNKEKPYRDKTMGVTLPSFCILDGLFAIDGGQKTTTNMNEHEIYAVLMDAKKKAKELGPMSLEEMAEFALKHPSFLAPQTRANRFGMNNDHVLLVDPVSYFRFCSAQPQDPSQDDSSVGGHSDHSGWEESANEAKKPRKTDEGGEGESGDEDDKDGKKGYGQRKPFQETNGDAINRKIRDSIRAAAKEGQEGVPDFMQNFVKDLLKRPQPKPENWAARFRRILANVQMEETRSTPQRESRRYEGGLGTKRLKKVDVLVAVDTSGSVSSDILARFINELKAMERQGAYVNVIFFHSSVYERAKLDDIKKDKFKLQSGGTNFERVFRYVKELKNRPDLFILLTDGEDNAPSTKVYVKTLWALYGQLAENQLNDKNSTMSRFPGDKLLLKD